MLFTKSLALALIATFAMASDVNAQAANKTANKSINKQLITQLKENLTKTDTSIDLTRNKIRTARDIQFLPELYLSLAELLVEKSRIKYAIKLEEAGDKPKAQLDFTAEKLIKFEAIEALVQIENRFPNFDGLDRVVFAIAHEYREMAEDDQALKAYKRLVDKFPNSKFWAESQYGIANIYYDRKDFEFALEQYKKILEKPNAGVMVMMAHYKMGLCYMQLDKSLNAVKAFESVLTSKIALDPEMLPQDFKRKDVREEALVASVKPLSDLSSEELRLNPKYQYVLDYYRDLAPNRSAYRAVLTRLGQRLNIKTRHYEAAQSYYALIEVANDLTQAKDAIEGYFFAMKKAKRDDHPVAAARVVSAWLWELKNDGKKNEFMKYEPVLRHIATSNHKNALKTKRPEDLNSSIESYQDYLWVYPSSKYKVAINLNMAEAAFHAGRHVEAGMWYKQLVTQTRNQAKQKDYFSSAFESFNKAFESQEKLRLIDKVQGRAAYASLSYQFARKFKNDPSLPDVVFNLAKSLYDGQDYVQAEKRLSYFIKRYPQDKNSSAAAILLLDCFYLRDDLKGLTAKGYELLKMPLRNDTKQEIRTLITQSAFKRVRSIAGDFASKGYAKEFLRFAKEAGKSPLGETALLEAFISLKAGQDAKAFQIGEQFIGQYGNSAKAKDVFNNIIQLALSSSDFLRAAKYLAAYSQKYPDDGSSSKFALSSAQLYEALGETDQAAKVYFALQEPERAADLYFKTQQWRQLLQAAPKTPGVKGLYYQGLAQYRLGQKGPALELMERVFNSSAATPEEKSYIGHAGYLLGVKAYESYRNVARNGVTAITSIKEKSAALADTDKLLWKSIETGVGEWVIASLHLQSILYRDYAQFLQRGPAPQPLSAEQYQKMIGPQIASYSKNADDLLVKCVASAEQAEVFTNFVAGCRAKSMGLIAEHSAPPARRKPASSGAAYAGIRAKLLKDASNPQLLDELAQTALKNADYAQATAVYSRLLEIKPNDPHALSQLGVLKLFDNSWSEALGYFKESLKGDPSNPSALWGTAGLYSKFGYREKLAPVLVKARTAGRPKTVTHPLMNL